MSEDTLVTEEAFAACATEPIHRPGKVQNRGVLLVVDDGVVVQVSENVTELLGHAPADVLGRPLADTVGADAVARMRLTDVAAGGPLADSLQWVTIAGRPWLVVSHAGPDGSLLVEAEPLPADWVPGETGMVFQDTHAVLREATQAQTVEELFALAATGVRRLTGFDRVMVYQFDREYNGHVVAEDKRGDLEPFLGHHYPASDIPPQARALYEKNWIRLISDVDAPTARLVPELHPSTGQPTDLTAVSLRAVSGVHIEYLRNMGVRSSMSISLLDGGRLWGMIACHHYAGPHAPTMEVRAAAESLASGLSLQVVVRAAADRARKAQVVADELRGLLDLDVDDRLADVVAQPRILSLLDCDGLVLRLRGGSAAVGDVPARPDAVVAAMLDELAVTGPRSAGVRASQCLAEDLPSVADDLGDVAGGLVIPLSDGDVLALFRGEVTREVTWGGDPRSKTVVVDDDGTRRLGPRRSFASWREIVRGTSRPWSTEDVDAAVATRRLVVEALYRQTRPEIGAALALKRSSLPEVLPQPDGWRLAARYRPADGGRVGGDWYDAFALPSGALALVVGDVAGHGLTAASSMSQLRNGLRSLLIAHGGPATAVEALDRLAKQLLPGEMATLWVGVLYPTTGIVEYVCAGHLPPLRIRPGEASWLELVPDLPLGYLRGRPRAGSFTLEPGESLLVYTDGLVERRGERTQERLAELRRTAGATQDLDVLEHAMAGVQREDDATMLLVTAPERRSQ